MKQYIVYYITLGGFNDYIYIYATSKEDAVHQTHLEIWDIDKITAIKEI